MRTTEAPAGSVAARTERGAAIAAVRRRRILVLLALILGVVACSALSVAVGAKSIPLSDVWDALVSPENDENDIIVRSLRVPRTILGILVGIALGMAGALMQGHTRNPLAEPGLLGVNAGAAFAVAVAIYSFGITDVYGFIWFAFAGALIASVSVFVLGSIGRGGATPVTLALAGAAVSFLLIALTSALVLMDQETLDTYRFWQVGALAGRPTDLVEQVAPFFAVGVVLALVNAPALNTLSLGNDVAKALGQSLRRTRFVGITSITLLAGAASAAVGPIGFVGLVVPHLARFVSGPDYRWLLPYAGLLGAMLVLLADTVGRVVARPGELQVGVVLALVGAPFFIWLVRRKKLASL